MNMDTFTPSVGEENVQSGVKPDFSPEIIRDAELEQLAIRMGMGIREILELFDELNLAESNDPDYAPEWPTDFMNYNDEWYEDEGVAESGMDCCGYYTDGLLHMHP
jgi:hypothetical protein